VEVFITHMSCRGKRARVILDDDADYDDDGADGDYTPAIDVDESFAAASDDDSTRVHHTMGTSAAAIVSSKGVPDRRKRRKTSDGGEAPVTASQRQWKRSPPSRPVAAAAMDPVEIVRRLQQRAKDAEQYQTVRIYLLSVFYIIVCVCCLIRRFCLAGGPCCGRKSCARTCGI